MISWQYTKNWKGCCEMEIRHLITFKTIVEVGSFTGAAEHLGYAQSTITGHIQALEESLGNPVFDRMGKKIVLTDLGNKLLKYATELLDVYEKIQNLSNEENVPQGVLKIGAIEYLMVYRLGPIFQEYKKRYPQVEIFLKIGPWWDLQEGLHKGELDIAFLWEPEVDEPDLVMENLIEEKMCFIFPPDYKQEELTFSNNQTILFTSNYRKVFEKYLQSKGIYTENSMEIGSVETIKRCVMSGIGISFLPLITVQNEIKEGKLSMIPWSPENNGMVIQVAYHKKKWISPAVEIFLQITKKHAQNW